MAYSLSVMVRPGRSFLYNPETPLPGLMALLFLTMTSGSFGAEVKGADQALIDFPVAT